MLQNVHSIVKAPEAIVQAFCDFVAEPLRRLAIFIHVQREHVAHIIDVLTRSKLGHAGWHHQCEQIDQRVCVLAQDVVRLGRVLKELMECLTLIPTHDVRHFGSEHESGAFALDPKLRKKSEQVSASEN